MATKAIDYMIVYYGDVSWRDLIVRWNGTGTYWKLYQVGVSDPIYEGPEQQFQFIGEPSTRYEFRVETTVDKQDHQSSVLTYTTALPAPINVTTTNVTSSGATLQWNPLFSVLPDQSRTNMITNPGFYKSADQWVGTPSDQWEKEYQGGGPTGGTYTGGWKKPGDTCEAMTAVAGVKEGVDYTFTIWAYTLATSISGRTSITWKDTAGEIISLSDSGSIDVPDVRWTQLPALTAMAPKGAVSAECRVIFTGSGITVAKIQAAMFEASDEPGTYFDGSFPQCKWLGDANASPSLFQPDVDEFYEVANVTDSYKVVAPSLENTITLSGLSPSTRCSYAVRSVYQGERSRWSNPVTFFTEANTTVAAGVYEFAPVSTYVWRAGRAGSTDPSWAPTNSNWFHGDGFVWGDNNGVQSTYFFFGSPNPFNVLYGANVTKCEVFLSRFTTGGEPGPVLSRVGLHENTEKPDGEPKPTPASVDVGELNRGESGWFEVPTEWAQQLIIGAFADGWYWGGCHERFQMAKNVDASVDPRLGMMRVTVG